MNHWFSLLSALIMASPIHGVSPQCTSRALEAVTSSVNDFGKSFMEVVSNEVTGDYICSPFSVDVVLSMLTYGADGDTKSELQQSLHSSDEALMKIGFGNLIDFFNNFQGVELTGVNKIFTRIGFQIKDEFMQITKTYFKSEVESVDFSNPDNAAAKINDWAAAHTNNRIKEFLKPDDVASNPALILANAVYFKGAWAHPFKPHLTRLHPFHVDRTVTKDVHMMYRKGYYNWGEINEIGAKYIELPYKNENISMFVFRPNEIDGLANMEKNMHKVNLTELVRPESEVELSMPKFKVETRWILNEILQKLNISNMFENSANFHRITDEEPLKVGTVIQKAYIEVNERGSEAAAVTAVMMFGSALVLTPPPEFVVDRPFLCTIAVKHSGGTIQIFNTRVSDPSSANQTLEV